LVKRSPQPLLCLLVFLLPTIVLATDREQAPASQQNGHRFITSALSHSGSSPFDPPKATDKTVVVDSTSGLDTGCTYRSGGPLSIEVPVKRVVGDVDASGHLLNAGALTSAGLLSHTAKLTLPVYDIDQPAEVDYVYFNDHFLGQLTGADGTWSINTFTIPIEWVNFGRDAFTANLPGINTVKIAIDQASGSAENWCMSVDWVELQFDAVAPIFMVHGIAAQSDTWIGSDITAPIPDYFQSLGIPFSYDINLEPNGNPYVNSLLLSSRLNQLAYRFGASQCHLIVHSKGGNDSRDYLVRYNDPSQLKVLSLNTLSTPFHGSVLADIIDSSRDVPNATSSNDDIKTVIEQGSPWLTGFTYQVPCCSALTSLRSNYMAVFNAATPFPGDVKFYNFSADADLNNDGFISASENHVYPNVLFIGGNSMAAAAYRTLNNVMSIKVVTKYITDSTGYPISSYPSLEPDATISTPLGNDLAVTFWSAQHPAGVFVGAVKADHTTIKQQQQAQGILSRIKADYPIVEP
jgi:pimeloyl-ACP methyl ester carboxylesterase